MTAPGAKLGQSSLRSFFAAGPSSARSSAVVSDYELLRQAKIRRNREFFQTLGIETPPPSTSESNPKPKSKPPKPCPEPAFPPRRSARKRLAPPPCLEQSASVEEYKVEEPDMKYVESAVFRYSASRGNARPRAHFSKLGSPDSALKLVGDTLGDARLANIYTMDIVGLCPNRLLVAAGGHGGFISVFGTEVGEEDGKDHDDEEEECPQALMCWKSSRSWVSGVSFVKGEPTLLISSSNDGRLVVWDVGKQPSCLALQPPVVGELNTIHANGIFSMDQAVDGAIATASKDSSVALTRIAGDKVVKEKIITGHHSGVIRGVCFRNTKDIMADCGADGLICVLDTRSPQPCTVSIESDHSTGVNTVNWSPSNEFLLLSSSKDPVLLLYDIRHYTQPVHKLHGHVESSVKTCHQIYRPAFIDRGRGIATPGQGSRKISVYDVESGEITSKGAVGYDANLVLCHLGELAQQSVWIAGRQINQLALPYCLESCVFAAPLLYLVHGPPTSLLAITMRYTLSPSHI